MLGGAAFWRREIFDAMILWYKMYQTSVKTSEKMSTHDEISDDDAMAGSDDALAVSDDALASSDDALAGRDDATAGCDDHAGHDNEMADADDVSRGIFLNNDGGKKKIHKKTLFWVPFVLIFIQNHRLGT